MIRCYLAGSMESVRNNGIKWRIKYKKELSKIGIDCIIPEEWEGQFIKGVDLKYLKKNNLCEYKKILRKIIFHDLKLIKEKSDFIIVKWDGEQTSGTIHEVGYNFHELGRYNFLVTSLKPIKISGWFLSCFDGEFKNLDEIIAYLKTDGIQDMIARRSKCQSIK